MADKCPKCGETLIKKTIQKKLGLGSIDFPVADICPKCNWSNDLTGAGDIVAKPVAPVTEEKLEKKPDFVRYASEKPGNIKERFTPVQGKPKKVLEKTKPVTSASKQRVVDMNRVITFALAFLVIAGIAWAFIPKGNEASGVIKPAPAQTPEVTASAKVTAPAAQVTPNGVKLIVRIDRYKYINPGQKDLKIKLGNEVVWINDDSYPLTLVSKEGLFEDKLLDNEKQTLPYLFKNTGTFNFDIVVNGVKKFSGTVTVEP